MTTPSDRGRDPKAEVRTRRALQGIDRAIARGKITGLTRTSLTGYLKGNGVLVSAVNREFAYTLFDHFADGPSVHTNGTEDDLYTDTLAAGQLAANGDKLAVLYAGYWIGHATATRRVRVYFGGTAVLDTGNILISADAAWEIRVSIIRVSAAIVRVSAVLVSEAAPQEVYTTSSEITGLTLAAVQIVKITGAANAAGAAAADIIARLGTIRWEPHA